MNPAKTVRDTAKQIAKQIAQEPVEILKDAGQQIAGAESGQSPNEAVRQSSQPQINTEEGKRKDQAFAQRTMQALQKEIEDIRKQETLEELQAKIASGEEVPLEEYPELSMEQKQVLKAQMEAVKIQMAQQAQASVVGVPSVSSKPSRRFGAGQKHEAEKQQTRTEKPVGPSQ